MQWLEAEVRQLQEEIERLVMSSSSGGAGASSFQDWTGSASAMTASRAGYSGRPTPGGDSRGLQRLSAPSQMVSSPAQLHDLGGGPVAGPIGTAAGFTIAGAGYNSSRAADPGAGANVAVSYFDPYNGAGGYGDDAALAMSAMEQQLALADEQRVGATAEVERLVSENAALDAQVCRRTGALWKGVLERGFN